MTDPVLVPSDPISERGVVRIHATLGGVVRAVDRIEEVVTSVLLVAVIAINGMEVFTRTVLDYSFSWIYEINLLAANWIYFIGICLVYYHNGDITVEVLDRFMSRKLLGRYRVLVNAVIVALMCVLIYYGGVLLAIQSRTKTLGLGVPNHLFSMPVVIGAVSMVLIIVWQSLGLWLEGRRTEAEAP
jgi:TRAP-type C4-dicarboxylate transport system permease small subunit